MYDLSMKNPLPASLSMHLAHFLAFKVSCQFEELLNRIRLCISNPQASKQVVSYNPTGKDRF